MVPPHELSVAEAGRRLRAGELTSQELTLNSLERIERLNPDLNIFIQVTSRRALADADRADAELSKGIDRGPLHGIPYAHKDIIDTAGINTTCHSHIRVDYVPAADSAMEERLRAGGAVLLGKLATHEFALGGPSFDLPFPPARNPWNPEHFTGGSSSGSAAAVAAGITRVTFGSDTSGSIRAPACYCGVVGVKPTLGRVSRRGVFPLSYSLDHCGPLGWSVDDAAAALQVVAGHDPKDPTSSPQPVPDFRAMIGAPLDGLRVGYAREMMVTSGAAEAEVVTAMDNAAQEAASLGARVEEVSLPSESLFRATCHVIMTAEGFAIHERDLRVRPESFGRFTYQRLVVGVGISASQLVQAYRLRRQLTVALNEGPLRAFHALLCANGLAPAPKISDMAERYAPRAVKQTMPFNVTGNPCLAMPLAPSKSGLPLGLQIVGRPFDEVTVFRIAAALETKLWPARRTPV